MSEMFDPSVRTFQVDAYYPGGVFQRVVNAVTEEEARDRAIQMFRDAGLKPVVIEKLESWELEKPDDGESTGRSEE